MTMTEEKLIFQNEVVTLILCLNIKKLTLLTFMPRQNVSYVFNGRQGVAQRTTLKHSTAAMS